jgi:TRAP-type mannitol/chloroaromatic compound transport system substrate-binding protein
MIQIANTGGLFFRGAIPVGWLAAGNMPPFVTRTNDEFNELYHHRGLDNLIGEGLKDQGIHFLGSHNVGNTYFWSKKPLHSVDDLKGFKVRFFALCQTAWNTLGPLRSCFPTRDLHGHRHGNA